MAIERCQICCAAACICCAARQLDSLTAAGRSNAECSSFHAGQYLIMRGNIMLGETKCDIPKKTEQLGRGAPPRVQLETPHFATSYPTAAGARSEQPRVSPYRRAPCPRPPEKRASHLSRLVGPGELQHGPKRADRRDRGGKTGLPDGEVPRGTLQSSSTTVATRSRPKLEVDVPGMVR